MFLPPRFFIDIVFDLIILGYFIYIIFLCHSIIFWELPYVPTMRKARRTLEQTLHITPEDHILDMGSWLGKMLLFFSRYPVRVTGIEKREILAFLSRIRLFLHPFKKTRKVRVLTGDFFNHSLNDYSIIYAFHIPRLIKNLAPKMEEELQKGQILISYKFPYPLSEHFVVETVEEEPGSCFYFYRRK